MPKLAKPPFRLPSSPSTSPENPRPKKGKSPDRSNPRIPIRPVKLEPGEQGRDADGHFIPPVPFPPGEEQAENERKDRSKLIKFGDVLDELTSLVPDWIGFLGPEAAAAQAVLEGMLEATIETMRAKLLFQGNPIIRQKLKPLWQQNTAAQVVMGAGSPTSIQRRVGGTGFAASNVPMPSLASITPPPRKKKKTDSQPLKR